MHSEQSPTSSANSFRWVVLAVGFFAQASVSIVLVGLPSLAIELRAAYGLSLSELGFLLAAFPGGMGLAMLPWGLLADRIGERLVMVMGLVIALTSLLIASSTETVVTLFPLLIAAGAGAAAVNASGGRSVMGWFAQHQRGMAMSIRHAAMPVGGAFGALALPFVAHHSDQPQHALLVGAAACAIGLVLVAATLVPGPFATAKETTVQPDKRTAIGAVIGLARFRRNLLVSGIMVVPQFGIQSFLVVIAVDVGNASQALASAALAAGSLAGAASRIAAGTISDRVHSRTRPFRWVAIASTIMLVVSSVTAATGSVWIVVSLGVSVTILTSWNAIALTAAAESVGHAGTGTALGIHNSLLVLLGMVTPPILAILAGAAGWTCTLLAMAVCCAAGGVLLTRHGIDRPTSLSEPG